MFKINFYICFIIVGLSAVSCKSIIRYSENEVVYNKNTSSKNNKIIGLHLRGFASFYSDDFIGKKTASGEIFEQDKFTAAHRDLPFGTLVEVTNLKNNKKCFVKINDRGPYVNSRIIDLSKSAAMSIGMINDGIIEVEIIVIE